MRQRNIELDEVVVLSLPNFMCTIDIYCGKVRAHGFLATILIALYYIDSHYY